MLIQIKSGQFEYKPLWTNMSASLTWPAISCTCISMWAYDWFFFLLIFHFENLHLFPSKGFTHNAQYNIFHFILLFDKNFFLNLAFICGPLYFYPSYTMSDLNLVTSFLFHDTKLMIFL